MPTMNDLDQRYELRDTSLSAYSPAELDRLRRDYEFMAQRAFTAAARISAILNAQMTAAAACRSGHGQGDEHE